MIEFVAMNRKVNINLEPGLYNFHPDFATGKTLLAKMVKSIGEKDKIAITYHDMLIGLDLEKIIAGKPQLLILDRFDLYDHEAEKLEVEKLEVKSNFKGITFEDKLIEAINITKGDRKYTLVVAHQDYASPTDSFNADGCIGFGKLVVFNRRKNEERIGKVLLC